ncbi:hypothetical protein [Kitasatospora sp. NPDC059571]|uniref:hypothetical protein n=1 Tax=Kitasatospora sp. NPDC059571 TaxID=3346871 RepID=UPI0036A4B5DF
MRPSTARTLAAALVTLTTACAGPSVGAGSAGAAPAAADGSETSATPDAQTITRQLTTKGLPVKLTVTYDATTDPDGQLGKPHQYVSRTAFDDTRVADSPKAKEDATGHRRDSISYGGTVEVFASADDAASAGPAGPDYTYRHGAVVVRVSHLLTPDQARAYETALAD